ncbi:MAG: RNA polymerase sigma factor [Planctomycetaceae bacterium]|nr:RNA polymerase sigma factor [Planctomycetaceae bacterium]
MKTVTKQPASPALPELNDSDFLSRLKAGDAEAFDQMMRQQGHSIQQLVARLMGWDTECEDVVQDIFIAAWEQLPRFRGEANLSTWLYAIAINQCRKYRRRQGRWRRFLGDLQQREANKHEIQAAPEAISDVAEIHRGLQALPQRDREAIVLCCLEDHPLEQAAEMLGIKKNALEVRLHRARKRLKTFLRQRSEP